MCSWGEVTITCPLWTCVSSRDTLWEEQVAPPGEDTCPRPGIHPASAMGAGPPGPTLLRPYSPLWWEASLHTLAPVKSPWKLLRPAADPLGWHGEDDRREIGAP